MFFGCGMDVVGVCFIVYLVEVNIIGYFDDYVQNIQKYLMDLLLQILIDKGWGVKCIGVEMDNYWFLVKVFVVL